MCVCVCVHAGTKINQYLSLLDTPVSFSLSLPGLNTKAPSVQRKLALPWNSIKGDFKLNQETFTDTHP